MNLPKITAILIIPALFILLNTFSLIYDADYLRNQSTDAAAASQIISYVQFGSALPLLSPSETSHMQDIRSIIVNVQLLTAALIVFFFILLYIIRKSAPNEFQRAMESIIIRGSILTVAIIIILALSALNFSAAFNSFHELFFVPGSFIFPSSSTLITLFPQTFFRNAAFQIIFAIIAQTIVLILLIRFDELQNIVKIAKKVN